MCFWDFLCKIHTICNIGPSCTDDLWTMLTNLVNHEARVTRLLKNNNRNFLDDSVKIRPGGELALSSGNFESGWVGRRSPISPLNHSINRIRQTHTFTPQTDWFLRSFRQGYSVLKQCWRKCPQSFKNLPLCRGLACLVSRLSAASCSFQWGLVWLSLASTHLHY